MKNFRSSSPALFLTAMILLFSIVCMGQTKTYRLLSKELDRTLWSLQIKGKKELVVISIDENGKKP